MLRRLPLLLGVVGVLSGASCGNGGKSLPVSLNLVPALCALLLMPNKLSLSVGGDTLLADPGTGGLPVVRAPRGVRSFHAATMLRTDVKGERGDV